MFKKVIVTFIVFCFSFGLVNGYNQAEVKLYYDKYYQSLVNRKLSQNDLISSLNLLNTKLTTTLKTTKTKKNTEFLNYIIQLNSQKISSLKSTSSVVLSNNQTSTKLLVGNDNKNYDISILPYKYIKVDSRLQFLDSGVYYRININKYLVLNSITYNYIKANNLSGGYIITLSDGSNIFTNDYNLEKKYTFDELKKLFTNTLDKSNPYQIDSNGNYVSYKYEKYLYFPDTKGLYLSDLKSNGINLNTSLFIKSDDKYYFVINYSVLKLANKSFIDGVTNKEEFLYDLYDDNKNLTSDNELYLSQIKAYTTAITKSANTNEEKIKLIYDWITNNIEYSQSLSYTNYKVYSGIETFKNRTGVCDGYTKLFQYMLSYAGITDVEIKRGYAFDNKDFPEFGHAWVRIGDNYYDPTFDDPIGKSDNSSYQYNYYKIPKEIIYANRFDGFDIPDYLSGKTLNERKLIAQKNLYNLYDKYSNYNLLKKLKNKIILGYNYNQTPTLSNFLEKMQTFSVYNFYYTDGDNSKKYINTLKYYVLDDDILSVVLSQNDFDITKAKLFKWYLDDGSYEYRLAYDITYK